MANNCGRGPVKFFRLPKAGRDDGWLEGIDTRSSTTPLLRQVTLSATWTNKLEHAADPHDYWGNYVIADTTASRGCAALARYQVYQRDDRRIRALVHTGDLAEAIRFCTSYAPGDSNNAFDQYDKALVAVIDINVQAFQHTIADGEQTLTPWPLLPWGLTVLALALLLIGIRPRLAEYR